MKLDGKHIAVIATDDFEDSELIHPVNALRNESAQVTIISNKADMITGKNGTEVVVDATFDEIEGAHFDALVIPGGVGNPDKMRTEEKAVSFVKSFFEQGKPVAAVCHGPWLLVEADAVRGRKVTSWPSLKTDLKNAGAEWVDEEVVVDGGLITSRKPEDLPAFSERMIKEFAEDNHATQAAY